jgi:twitching motility protein PilT
MNDVNSLLAVLELTGGARVVLRSDERPHVIVGDTRHELATAPVPTTPALEAVADQILSPTGKRVLAEQRVVEEPLAGHDSAIPIRVVVRRIGPQMSVELQRNAQNSEPARNAPTPGSVAVTAPPEAFRPVSASRPAAMSVSPPVPTESVRNTGAEAPAFDSLIRRAAERNATAVYLRSGQVPLMRVGARMEELGADPLPRSVIDTVTAATPGDDQRGLAPAVWVHEYEGIGQVRWHAFTDERGPGLIVRLGWRSPEAVLQRGIPQPIRRVCQEDDGIIVVSATATDTVLDMIGAIGSWTGRRRAGYLISIEPPGGLGREIGGGFVSTRRVGGADNDIAAAIQRAAREAPDVLVVALPLGVAAEETVRAAKTGTLVILGILAPTATSALESLLAGIPPQHGLELRRSLAAWLRCAFSYRVFHSAGQGRVLVHDLLLATPDVRVRLERGDIAGLDKLQRSGADGMRSLDAALARAAVNREISLRQAASHAHDRREVVTMVRRSARDRRRTRAR